MIIYGVLSDTSIGKLFIAGIIPGLILASMYSAFIIFKALTNPHIVPESDERTYTFKEKLKSSKELFLSYF